MRPKRIKQLSEDLSNQDQIESLYEKRTTKAWLLDEEYYQRFLGTDNKSKENRMVASRIISDGFKTLTPRQRIVLQYHILGESQENIASKVGIHQSRVSRLLAQSSKKLWQIFQQYREKYNG